MQVKINNDRKVDIKIILFGLACLTTLEIVALCNGINGTMFTMVIAIIAGITGFVVPTPNLIKK